MARIRSVHPDICIDEMLPNVSASAERTFVRLWTHLDDEGRAKDHPRLLVAALYPLHDDMTIAALDIDLEELADHCCIARYSTAEGQFISAKPDAWKKYQKPRHPTPSQFPAPPPEAFRHPTADRRNGTADPKTGAETTRGGSSTAPMPVTAEVLTPEGSGEEGSGEEKSFPPSSESEPSASGKPKRKRQVPDDWCPSDGLVRWWRSQPEASLADPIYETPKFVDHHRSKGTTFSNIDAAWRTWMRNAVTYAKQRGARVGGKSQAMEAFDRVMSEVPNAT